MKVLGRGSFGSVYLIKKKQTQQDRSLLYALKVVKKGYNQELEQILKNEKNILSQLKSPFIVKYEFFVESKNKLHMGLEYCARGDLFEYITDKTKDNNNIAKRDIQFMGACILLGIEYLHS